MTITQLLDTKLKWWHKVGTWQQSCWDSTIYIVACGPSTIRYRYTEETYLHKESITFILEYPTE
jgi:hypothetical protein